MDAAWAVADILMGGMTFINLPVCVILGKVAIDALNDYTKQRKELKKKGSSETPVFLAKNIALDESELDFWKSEN